MGGILFCQKEEYFNNRYIFKINNDEFSANTEPIYYKFKELKLEIKSNLRYWKDKLEKYENVKELYSKWKALNDSFIEIEKLIETALKEDKSENWFIDSVRKFFNSDYSSYNELYVFKVNIESPMKLERGQIEFEEFIKFILVNRASINFLEVLQSYYLLKRNRRSIINYISDDKEERYLPAIFLLKKDMHQNNENVSWKEMNDSLSKDIEILKKDLELTATESSKLIENKDNEFHLKFQAHLKNVEDYKESIDLWKSKKEIEIDRLEKTYKHRLQTEAPVQLWDERSKIYNDKAQKWISFLIFSFLLLVLVFGLFYSQIQDFLSGKLEKVPFISDTFVLVAVVSFIIYLIRVIVKIILSNQHMAMEYEQKAAIARYYEALLAEGGEVDDSIKPMIFGAMLSKVETGLVKIDNNLDLESIISVLKK